MAGYEANARVSADVSQFVGASREAARAAGTFGVAVRELRNDLQRMEHSARNAADAVKPFTASMRQSAASQQQTAQATQQLVSGLRVNSQAFETGAQAAENYAQTQQRTATTGRALAQELTRTENKLHEVQRAMALGTDSTQNLGQTADTLSQHLVTLYQRYERLNTSQQEAVDQQIALRRAYQSATDAGREATRVTRQLNATREEQIATAEQARLATDNLSEQERHAAQMTESALRSMAREMERVAQQREQLNRLNERQNGLNEEMQDAYQTLTQRLEALQRQYSHLNTEQRQVVDSTRQIQQASQQSAQAVQQLGRQARETTSFLEHLSRAIDNSTTRLFALNAMLTDVEMGLMSVAWGAERAGRFLFETFSAQEMATAHLARVTQESDAQVARLADTVEDLSERIPVPFEDLARIGVLGAQVGIADQHLDQFIETVALFTSTTDVAEEQASLMFARLVEMTEIEESEIQNMGAAVSELGSNASATEDEILKVTESIATASTQAGLSETTILGLGSALASLHVQPQLARGAMQRVFTDLGETAQNAGDGMQRLSEITGTAGQELQALQQDNPEEFFFRVLEGLHGLSEEGENLIPILREIGIINSRDANVVAKLASEYELLDEQVNRANASFSEGTFLQQESARLFDTLTKRVDIFINAWKNFLSDAVAAVAPFLIEVVEAGTAVAEFLDEFEGMHEIVGVGTVIMAGVGALAALSAGLVGAMRAAVALRNVIGTFSSAWASYTGATTSATAATAAMTSVTAGATTRVTSFVASLGLLGKAGVAGAVIAGVWGIAEVIGQATQSTEEYNQELLESQESHHQAAGGMEQLRSALEQDTQAWRQARESAEAHAQQQGASSQEAQKAAEEMSDAAALRTLTTSELTEEQRDNRRETRQAAQAELDYQESMHGSIAELENQREEMEGSTSEIDAQIAKQEDLQNTIDDNKASVEEQTVAIGLATYEWQQASLESAVLETNILQNTEAMEAMEDAGINLGNTLNTALAREAINAGEGVELLDNQIARLEEDLAASGNTLRQLLNIPDMVHALGLGDAFLSDTEAAIQNLEDIRDNVEGNSVAAEEAAQAGELFTNGMVEMSDEVSHSAADIQEMGQQQAALQGETAASAEEIAQMGAQAAVMDLEIQSLGMTIQDVSDSFGSFVEPLDAWKQAQQEANQAVEDADNGISSMTENAEVSFDRFLEIMDEQTDAQQNWGRNLLQLSDQVPPEVIAGLTDMGAQGAGIVRGLANANSDQVDRFVQDWKQGGGQTLDEFATVYSTFLQQSIEAGDSAGREFANNLIDQYLDGSITFTEMTDEMTTYAEEEFQGADTTNEPQLIDQPAIDAMNNLATQMEQIANDADADVKPGVDDSGIWNEVSSLWDSVQGWFNRNPIGVDVAPRGDLDELTNGGSGYASGGWINGQGGPRQDNIPIMASDDEFVVNAASAKQFAPLLEWINSQHSSGVSEMNAPNFVPDDLLRTPRRPLSALNEHTPEAIMRSQATPQGSSHEKVVVNVNNQYPQAEPTSTTVNRSLQYAAALDGLS